jgi:sugar phosphate isomerase/epimerase
MKRRSFVKSALLSGPVLMGASSQSVASDMKKSIRLKLSLNTYSFNQQLRSGETDIFELIDYCKEIGFEAIDPTGYYFSGYPDVPEDNVIFDFKRKAFLAGIEISGTGVRNDFANADPVKRAGDLRLIEGWCNVASKLGAPLLRVFPGKKITDGRDKAAVIEQVIAELKIACRISEKYGVMLAMQNHNDFLLSSEEVEAVMQGVDSRWLGLHLDIGSLAQRDPYIEIERLVKYAITWQIKEKVWLDGQQVSVDYDRLMSIILRSDYTGYLPLETLRTDPLTNLPKMIDEIRKRLPD